MTSSVSFSCSTSLRERAPPRTARHAGCATRPECCDRRTFLLKIDILIDHDQHRSFSLDLNLIHVGMDRALELKPNPLSTNRNWWTPAMSFKFDNDLMSDNRKPAVGIRLTDVICNQGSLAHDSNLLHAMHALFTEHRRRIRKTAICFLATLSCFPPSWISKRAPTYCMGWVQPSERLMPRVLFLIDGRIAGHLGAADSLKTSSIHVCVCPHFGM